MSKSNGNGRHKQTIRFLKWINRYSGWWYLICTPKDEHINPSIMQTLIEQLAKEQFYEIIFVLLMVHRDEEFVKSTEQAMFVEMLIAQWNAGNKDELIKSMIDHFE